MPQKLPVFIIFLFSLARVSVRTQDLTLEQKCSNRILFTVVDLIFQEWKMAAVSNYGWTAPAVSPPLVGLSVGVGEVQTKVLMSFPEGGERVVMFFHRLWLSTVWETAIKTATGVRSMRQGLGQMLRNEVRVMLQFTYTIADKITWTEFTWWGVRETNA